MFEVVIFDLDGLLVDSEPLQYRAFNEVFSRYGCPLRFDEYLRWRDWQLTPRWIEHYGLSLDAEVVRAEKKKVYDRLVREEVALKPGAESLVHLAAGHCRLCIASGSRLESIEACLEKFGLLGHFQSLVSTTTVGRGKPHPDVFLEAASRMSVVPERALVVENAASGLRAARAAGMRCIVCPDAFAPDPPEHYEDADLIVRNLEEVTIEVLRELAAD